MQKGYIVTPGKEVIEKGDFQLNFKAFTWDNVDKELIGQVYPQGVVIVRPIRTRNVKKPFIKINWPKFN